MLYPDFRLKINEQYLKHPNRLPEIEDIEEILRTRIDELSSSKINSNNETVHTSLENQIFTILISERPLNTYKSVSPQEI